MKKIIANLLPDSILRELLVYKNISKMYGHYRSAKFKVPVDKKGNPIPWYTYPAIEYITQVDYSDKTVFEYGSGNSSIFWSKRAKKVISVENDKSWFEVVQKSKIINQEIILRENEEGYVHSISEFNQKFDVIIIDGSFRRDCSKIAIKYLKKTGFIIFDNCDWYQRSALDLRKNHEFTQIDFHGFSPTNTYSSTTSLFFWRDFKLNPLDKQPIPSCAAIKKDEFKLFS